ncbi:MAG: Clp protease [Actinomycetota bacterium]|nr:Clp protease [Actinomycetota bacterium]
MFERFDITARETVVSAQSAAKRLGHHYIGTEHLLLGLLDQSPALAARLLIGHGLDKPTVEQRVIALAGGGADELDAAALDTIGIDLSAVRSKVEITFGAGALDRGVPTGRGGRRSRKPVSGHLPFTKRAKKSLELALRAADRLGHPYIGDGHLLLGLLDEGGGLAFRVVDGASDIGQLRTELEAQIPNELTA